MNFELLVKTRIDRRVFVGQMVGVSNGNANAAPFVNGKANPHHLAHACAQH